MSFSAVADHSVEGREDLASVYIAPEALQAQAERLNAESKPGKGTKKGFLARGIIPFTTSAPKCDAIYAV